MNDHLPVRRSRRASVGEVQTKVAALQATQRHRRASIGTIDDAYTLHDEFSRQSYLVARNAHKARKKETNDCEECNAEFGLFRWKHTCSVCTRVLCDDCAPQQHEASDARLCQSCAGSAPEDEEIDRAVTPCRWQCAQTTEIQLGGTLSDEDSRALFHVTGEFESRCSQAERRMQVAEEKATKLEYRVKWQAEKLRDAEQRAFDAESKVLALESKLEKLLGSNTRTRLTTAGSKKTTISPMIRRNSVI
jgi:hypothetical protein